MRIQYGIIWTLLLVAVVSCKKDAPAEDGPYPIRFQVTQTPAITKSMVSTEEQLRYECTPTGDPTPGAGKSIGLWAAMKKGTVVTNDVFKGVRLQWHYIGDPKSHESNPDTDEIGNLSYWNTMVTESGVDKFAEIYWHPGEIYYFRAYYPAGVELANNTSATTFIAEYNTENQQEDLMAAYQKVELNSTTGSMQQHVQLNMQHMLSAVQFKFKYKEEAGFEKEDKIVSVWLENTSTGQLGDYGLLVYGDGKPESDPTANPRKIEWYIMDTPAPGTRMYYWEHSSGIVFRRTSTENTAAIAYSDPSQTTSGALFASNSWEDESITPHVLHNYVYMIPQPLHTGTQICFTTENSAGNVFRVDLPDSFTDNSNVTHTSLDPGWRYTFTIVISRLDIQVFITIREWNKMDSSYTIDF